MNLTTFIAELEKVAKESKAGNWRKVRTEHGVEFETQLMVVDADHMLKLLACVKVLSAMVEKSNNRAWCNCNPDSVAYESMEALSKCESIITGEK